jgi:hypothetical protein
MIQGKDQTSVLLLDLDLDLDPGTTRSQSETMVISMVGELSLCSPYALHAHIALLAERTALGPSRGTSLNRLLGESQVELDA